MKANALKDADGIWHNVSKTPATDPTKGSKAGRHAVFLEQGELVGRGLHQAGSAEDKLIPIWCHDFEQIRQCSEANC